MTIKCYRGCCQFDYSSRCWSATISAKPIEGQQPQPVQDLDQVLGRIQDIVVINIALGGYTLPIIRRNASLSNI